MNLFKRIILLTVLLINSSFAISIPLDGTQTLLSGTECSTATYRFGTTSSYQDEELDIILEVLSEDNEFNLPLSSNKCVDTQNNVISFHIKDNDPFDNVASMDLKFTIVKKGTTTPIVVDELTVTNFDLDIVLEQHKQMMSTIRILYKHLLVTIVM